MPSEPEPPIELLYRALNAQVGIIVHTAEPERMKAALYAARAKDPDLRCLSILTSPTNPTGELWIARKEAPDAD